MKNPSSIVSIKRRLAAIEPFYHAYAVGGLPRTKTFYALKSPLTGLFWIGCTAGPLTSGNSLVPVHSLAVHDALVEAVGRDLWAAVGSCRVEGCWFDIRGDCAGELEHGFAEWVYQERVADNLGRLLPRACLEDPGRWSAAMHAQLSAAETWLLTCGASHLDEHHAGGVTRRTFRPGRPPLVKHFGSPPYSRPSVAAPVQLSFALTVHEAPTRLRQSHGHRQPQPSDGPVLPKPQMAGPATASRRKAAASPPDNPPRQRAQKGSVTQPLLIPPKGFGCARSPRGYNPSSLTVLLRLLQVGESVVVTRNQERKVGAAAKRLGIRIAHRRLGSRDTTTIYRTS